MISAGVGSALGPRGIQPGKPPVEPPGPDKPPVEPPGPDKPPVEPPGPDKPPVESAADVPVYTPHDHNLKQTTGIEVTNKPPGWNRLDMTKQA